MKWLSIVHVSLNLYFHIKFIHMKIFTSVLIILALGLLIFNITQLDFNHFTEDNKIALIGIFASFCAILILLIFRLSKKIEEKTKN
jgi:hypothetical protein